MLYFFDTSALVKRYHLEEGSHIVNDIFEAVDSRILIANITMAEFVSALNRKKNRKELTEEALRLTLGKFAADTLLNTIRAVIITNDIVLNSHELILQYNLTSSDAIILSACLEFREMDPIFVCSDVNSGLVGAAKACRISTLNPLSA